MRKLKGNQMKLAVTLLIVLGLAAQDSTRLNVHQVTGETWPWAVFAVQSPAETIISVVYVLYDPQPDITAFELAKLVPLFSGGSYSGPYLAPDGRVVPMYDRRHGGWPANGTVLCLVDGEITNLGTAARHLKKLP